MKKLFTFLALMLCYVGMAVAQTEVTATWLFNAGGGDQEVVLSEPDCFKGSYVALGSNFSWNGTESITYGESTVNESKIKSGAKNTTPKKGVDNLDFIISPKKGLKFTPKTVSYTSTRFGTGGGYINTYWVNPDGTEVELAKDQKPSRKGDTEDAVDFTDYSYDISNVTVAEGECGLRLYIHTLDAGKNYGFYNIVITGTIEGEAIEEITYNVTTVVSPEGAGSVSHTPSGAIQTAGTSLTFIANENVGYKFLNKWTVNGNEVEGETYSIASLSDDTEVVAQFKKLPTISFAKPEGVHCVNRMFPATVNTYDVGETYTLPFNYMYYKEGYTMIGWEINGTEYKCGDAYVVTEENVTATPVFTKNSKSIASRSGDLTVTFDFDQSTNKGRVVNIENNEDYIITTVNVDGEDIDVALSVNCKDNEGIDGKRGKFNNTSGSRAQVNPGAVLNISLEKGGTITIKSDNINFKEGFTFNGVVGDIDGSKIAYTAENAEDVIVISQQENMYIKSVVITYPAPSYSLTTTDTDLYGLYLPYQASVPEDVTAYTGTLSADQTTLTLSKVEGVIPANTAVLVKSYAAGEYTFNVSDGETIDAIANNSLKGVTIETAVSELAEEGKTVLTLGMAEGVVAFRQPAAETIKANKVYLLVDAASSAKIRIVEGETTGIEENYEFGIKNSDAATYDLSGRKVSNPTKGLYIKSGKKFIVK